MYQCLCCGRRFSAPNWQREARGECFGFPAWEGMAGCPYCGGFFEEAKEARP